MIGIINNSSISIGIAQNELPIRPVHYSPLHFMSIYMTHNISGNIILKISKNKNKFCCNYKSISKKSEKRCIKNGREHVGNFFKRSVLSL